MWSGGIDLKFWKIGGVSGDYGYVWLLNFFLCWLSFVGWVGNY